MIHLLISGVSSPWLKAASEKGIDIGEVMEPTRMTEEAKQVSLDLKAFKDIHYEIHVFEPEDDANFKQWEALLMSRKWDGISVGGGVRTIHVLGEYFTRLMNLAIATQPQATFVFPLTPAEVVPVLKKHIPGLA